MDPNLRRPASLATYRPDDETAAALTARIDRGQNPDRKDLDLIIEANGWQGRPDADILAAQALAEFRRGQTMEPQTEPNIVARALQGGVRRLVGGTNALAATIEDLTGSAPRTPEEMEARQMREQRAQRIASAVLPQTATDLVVDLLTFGMGKKIAPLKRLLTAAGGGAAAGASEATVEGRDSAQGAAAGALQAGLAQGVGEVGAKSVELGRRFLRRPPQDVPGATNIVKQITGTQLPLETADDLIKFAAGRGQQEALATLRGQLGLLENIWSTVPLRHGMISPADAPSLWRAYGLDPGQQLNIKQALELFTNLGPKAFKEGALRGLRDSGELAAVRAAAKKELAATFGSVDPQLGKLFTDSLGNYSRTEAVLRVLKIADPAKFTRPDGSLDMLAMRRATIKQLKDLDARLKPDEVDALLDWVTRGGPLAKQDVPTTRFLTGPLGVPVPRQVPSYVGSPFVTSPAPFTLPLVSPFGAVSRQVYPPRKRETNEPFNPPRVR